MEAVGVGIFVIVIVAIFAAAIGAFVYWIIALIEVVQIPEQQYRAAGTDKVTWVLVVALAQIIGALVWRFAKRRDVLAAKGQVPLPPPGWYPDPDPDPDPAGTGAWRWWDGTRWHQ